ncbi:MAG TPA: YkgJ family cysteine cluster protein [Candidatus Deferrimicrobiaceae bacterium]|nr:YkgJ family cysteine cluster protein [Candidatus Deferrimicrobiaceae bacterium]
MTEDNGATFSFNVCSQCRSICCQDAKPPLTNGRKKIIQKYVKNQKIDLKDPFTQKEYSYPAVDEEIYCRLFNKSTGKCIVHPVKPETCVAGPVTFNINFCTKKVEWFIKTKELCAFAGVLFEDKVAFKAHFEVGKRQILALIAQLGADELRALMKIDEPMTFKFAEDDLPKEVVKKLGL